MSSCHQQVSFHFSIKILLASISRARARNDIEEDEYSSKIVTEISLKLKWNKWNEWKHEFRFSIKKKQTGIAPFFFLRCKFGGKIGCEGGGEGSVHVSPMSTHDRSCVGRGINMKSCRLIYDPGRPLLDL